MRFISLPPSDFLLHGEVVPTESTTYPRRPLRAVEHELVLMQRTAQSLFPPFHIPTFSKVAPHGKTVLCYPPISA